MTAEKSNRWEREEGCRTFPSHAKEPADWLQPSDSGSVVTEAFLKDNNNAALDELMGRQASFCGYQKPFNHRYFGVSEVASYRTAYISTRYKRGNHKDDWVKYKAEACFRVCSVSKCMNMKLLYFLYKFRHQNAIIISDAFLRLLNHRPAQGRLQTVSLTITIGA